MFKTNKREFVNEWRTTITIFAALIFAVAMPASSQQTVNEREEIRIKRIKKITEVRYEYENGVVAAKGIKWGYHEYDSRGNHVVNGRYSAGGGTTQGHPMYLRSYDEANRPVRRVWYCNRTPEKPEGKVCLVFKDYKLDQYGNVAEENGYDPQGQFIARVSFKRDESGRPVERTDHVVGDEANQKKYVYIYDDDKGTAKITTFDHQGKLIETTMMHYRYDENKNVTEMTKKDSSGNQINRFVHRYDENGLKTETEIFDDANRPVRLKKYIYELY